MLALNFPLFCCDASVLLSFCIFSVDLIDAILTNDNIFTGIFPITEFGKDPDCLFISGFCVFTHAVQSIAIKALFSADFCLFQTGFHLDFGILKIGNFPEFFSSSLIGILIFRFACLIHGSNGFIVLLCELKFLSQISDAFVSFVQFGNHFFVAKSNDFLIVQAICKSPIIRLQLRSFANMQFCH